MFCPNIKNKQVKAEFDELVSAVGEKAAYVAWNENGGLPMSKTPSATSRATNPTETDIYKAAVVDYINTTRVSSYNLNPEDISGEVLEEAKLYFGDFEVKPGDTEFTATTTNVEALKKMIELKNEYSDYAKIILPVAEKTGNPLYLMHVIFADKPGIAGINQSSVQYSEVDPGELEYAPGLTVVGLTAIETPDGFRKNLIHEITHSVTSEILTLDSNLSDSIQGYINYIEMYNKKMTDDATSLRSIYGLTNPSEFVAEFWSNSKFRTMLSRIPAMDKGKFEWLFDEIFSKIRSWLIGESPAESALEQITPIMQSVLTLNAELYEGFDTAEQAITDAIETRDSRLFADLLTYYDNNVKLATQAKVMSFSNSFKTLQGTTVDENGEPFAEQVIPFGPQKKESLTKELTPSDRKSVSSEKELAAITSTGTEQQKQVARSIIIATKGSESVEIIFTNEKLDEKFGVDKGTPAVYNHSDGKIYVTRHIPSYSELDLNSVILHELVHAYTVEQIDNNTNDAQTLQKIYNEYVKHHNDYASKSIYEFASEVFTNPQTQSNLEKINLTEGRTLLNKVMDFIKGLFGKKGVKAEALEAIENMILATNASKKVLTNIESGRPRTFSANPIVFRKSGEQIAFEKIDEDMNILSDTIDRLVNSMPYSNISARFDAMLSAIAASTQIELDSTRQMERKNIMDDTATHLNDVLNYVYKIDGTRPEAHRALDEIDSIRTRADSLDDDNLYSLATTALKDFDTNYLTPNLSILTSIRDTITDGNYRTIYEDVLTRDEYRDLLQTLNSLIDEFSHDSNDTSSNIGYRFSDITSKRIAKFVEKQLGLAEDPTMAAKLQDLFRFSEGDINWYTLYIGTIAASNTELKMLRRLAEDISFRINKEVAKKEPVVRQAAQKKVNKMLLFERDENGKIDGYFVQPRKYGLWAKRKREWKNKWMKANGVINFKELRKDPALYRKYSMEMNDYITKNVERKYDPKFYAMYAALSPVTQTALSEHDVAIDEIKKEYMDERGITQYQDIPHEIYDRLMRHIEQKRSLASIYDYTTGEEKPIGSDARQVADELTELYDNLRENMESDIDWASFNAERKRIEEDGNIGLDGRPGINLWLERNTERVFTPEFEKMIQENQAGITLDPDNELHQLYSELSSNRAALLKMYRTPNGDSDFIRMPESFKERIRELDYAIDELAHEMRRNAGETPKRRKKRLFYAHPSETYVDWKRSGFSSGNDHYVSNGKRRLHSYYIKVDPINKDKYTTVVPNKNWRETSSEAKFFNKNYDPTIPYREQPKLSIPAYDNRQAYNKMRSDKNTSELYDVLVNTMQEANDILKLDATDMYRMPQKRGSMWNYIQSHGVWKGLLKYGFDSLIIGEDDPSFNRQPSVMPDGSPIDVVPTFYLSPLVDPSVATRDIAKSVLDYYEMAVNNKIKNETAPLISLYIRELDKRAEIESTSANEKNTPKKKSRNSNITKRLRKLLEVSWYSRPNQPIVLSGSRKGVAYEVTVDKLVHNFSNYSREVGLGWKVASAFGGAGAATNFYLSDARIGNIISMNDMNVGFRDVIKSFMNGSAFSQLGANHISNRLYAMMKYNATTYNPMEERKNMTRSRLGRIVVGATDAFAVWKASSIFSNAVFFRAVYNNYRLVTLSDGSKQFMSEEEYINLETKDLVQKFGPNNLRNQERDIKRKKLLFRKNNITLWNAYDMSKTKDEVVIKKEYEQYVTLQLETDVHAKINYIVAHAEGMMPDHDKGLIYHQPIAATVTMFRNFFPGFIENNFSGWSGNKQSLYYNHQTKQLAMGTITAAVAAYRLGIDVRILGLYNPKNGLFKKNGRYKPDHPMLLQMKQEFNIDNPEIVIRKYVRRLNSQVSAALLFHLLFVMYSNMSAIDDEYGTSFLAWLIYRTRLETGSRYNPMEVINMFNSVSAITKTVGNWARLVGSTANPSDWFTEVESGPYKGLTIWEKDFVKVIPISNLYFGLKDPGQSLDNLQRNLNR